MQGVSNVRRNFRKLWEIPHVIYHVHRFRQMNHHFIPFLIFQRERQFIHDRNEPPYRSLLCISLLLGWAAQSHCTFAEIYVLFCLISCTRTLLYNNIVRTNNRGVHTYLLSAMTLAVPTISNTSYFSDWSTHNFRLFSNPSSKGSVHFVIFSFPYSSLFLTFSDCRAKTRKRVLSV